MFAKQNAATRPGFLMRLRQDQTGNAIMLMAFGLIPLTGMIGSGIDISRVYLVKARLQQACDAGALAGRKTMGSGNWTTASNTVASNMFAANFSEGTSGSETLTNSYTEAGGVVRGTASVDVPMVVMKIFGRERSSIDVQCEAQLAVPNTDVMFVLDTTGSMNCPDDGSACPGGNNNGVEVTKSKIVGMRRAVRCFYEALSKQNTIADCGSTPSGATQTAQTRFGFVPYAVNVNVGRLLPNEFFADSAAYQSRVPVLTPVWVYALGNETTPAYGALSNPATPTAPSSYVSYVPSSNTSTNVTINSTSYATVLSSASCPRTAPAANTVIGAQVDVLNSTNTAGPVHPATTNPFGSYTRTIPQTRTFYRYIVSNSRCRLQFGTAAFNRTASGSSNKPVTWTQFTDTFTNWEYRPVTHNVSGLKNAGAWNGSVPLPVGFTTQTLLVSGTTGVSYKRAANMTANWEGCIEERATVRATDHDPFPTGANDLNVDDAPTGDVTTQWAPFLPAAIWGRYTGTSTETTLTVTTSSNLSRNLNNFDDDSDGNSTDNFDDTCPAEARIPTQWADAAAFDTYVTGLTGGGSTYHDIGLIWGARLISPTGLFATNNTNRQNIQRHVVFMTDGDTSTNAQNYGAYGAEWWDRRRTPTATNPDTTLLNAQVNSRFLAMCEYIKNDMGITLWVVAFGAGVSTSAQNNMDTCASPGRSLTATNSAALLTTFRGIADEISDLRLTN